MTWMTSRNGSRPSVCSISTAITSNSRPRSSRPDVDPCRAPLCGDSSYWSDGGHHVADRSPADAVPARRLREPDLHHRTIMTDTICHGGIPGRKIIESLLCERNCAGSGAESPTCGKTSSVDRVLVQPAAM
jgi:hypothetical protein